MVALKKKRTKWFSGVLRKAIWSEMNMKVVFCSTGSPLASTRWVWLTFSSHCPLSSNQHRWLTSAASIIFPLKFLGNTGNRTPGCCTTQPQPPRWTWKFNVGYLLRQRMWWTSATGSSFRRRPSSDPSRMTETGLEWSDKFSAISWTLVSGWMPKLGTI